MCKPLLTHLQAAIEDDDELDDTVSLYACMLVCLQCFHSCIPFAGCHYDGYEIFSNIFSNIISHVQNQTLLQNQAAKDDDELGTPSTHTSKAKVAKRVSTY